MQLHSLIRIVTSKARERRKAIEIKQ